MSDTQSRLQEEAQKCIQIYSEWSNDNKNAKARENLSEAVHDLRKAISRVEIELAVSERRSDAGNNLKPPKHRSSNRSAQGSDAAGNSGDDKGGESAPKPRRRRPSQKNDD